MASIRLWSLPTEMSVRLFTGRQLAVERASLTSECGRPLSIATQTTHPALVRRSLLGYSPKTPVAIVYPPVRLGNLAMLVSDQKPEC